MKLIISELINKIDSDMIDIFPLLNIPNYFNPKNNVNIQLLKDIIIKRLKEKPKSSQYKLFKLLNLTESDIIQKETIKLKEYNIFGCPLSTDIDIAFLVSSPDIIERYKHNKIVLDFRGILDEIKKDYPDRNFDINLITKDSQNNLSMAYKGSKETQNIIFNTYRYHQQKYPIFFDKQIDIDLNDKIRGLCVFVLEYLKDIIGDKEYKNQREIKKRIFNNPSERIKYVNEILNNVDITIDKNIIKSITMKLIQIILLNDNLYAYTKKDMINLIQNYFNTNYETELWNLLTRDIYHIKCDNIKKQFVFNLLVTKYITIYNEMLITYHWKEIIINFDNNPTKLDENIIREFIKSPLKPSEKFLDLAKYIMDDDINKYFILDIFGTEFLPTELHKYIIFEPQRSLKWIELHRKFNNNKLHVQGDKYSMIRGAIGEMFITLNCDFSEICGEPVKKCSIGFIKEGNNLCAPDLLLINDKIEIIPIEIKSLPFDVTFDMNNRAFHREFKLARKQISYISQIINNIYEKKVKKGIIIFVYFGAPKIKTYYTIIDFDVKE
jgi:hypothetical protein